MTDDERYGSVDLPFYRDNIAKLLPESILDFHTHAWRRDQWIDEGKCSGVSADDLHEISAGTSPYSRYMVASRDYSAEQLLADACRIFPENRFHAVFFGQPTPAVDVARTNAYVADSAHLRGLFPLRVTGRAIPKEMLRDEITEQGFFGFKVFLPWIGDDYGSVGIEEMIGPAQMELANELGLVVLLHVPGSARLADPRVREGVRRYAQQYPNASLVLAHCGRCYLPRQMIEAVSAVADLPNVYFDTGMVMDPSVLRMAFEHVGPSRVLFGTDLPIAGMRGKRVSVLDHWVDLVLEDYPPSAYRVCASEIHATFMAYEIALAIQMGAEMAGLSDEETRSVFWQNGLAVLGHAMGGDQLRAAYGRWGTATSTFAAERHLLPRG